MPLQSPDAVHDCAPADDHVRVVELPTETDVGLAVSVVVNTCGLTTLSTAELLADSDWLEHVNV